MQTYCNAAGIMIERIKQLMEAKNLSSTQFADGIEVPRAIVSHILSGRNKPSLDVVVKILDAHRDVSMDWLLLGEGEMLKKLAANAVTTNAPEALREEKAAPAKEAAVEEEPVEKVQKSKKVETEKPLAKQSSKTIERIIIFYDDKTFDTYSPV